MIYCLKNGQAKYLFSVHSSMKQTISSLYYIRLYISLRHSKIEETQIMKAESIKLINVLRKEIKY